MCLVGRKICRAKPEDKGNEQIARFDFIDRGKPVVLSEVLPWFGHNIRQPEQGPALVIAKIGRFAEKRAPEIGGRDGLFGRDWAKFLKKRADPRVAGDAKTSVVLLDQTSGEEKMQVNGELFFIELLPPAVKLDQAVCRIDGIAGQKPLRETEFGEGAQGI